MDAQPFSPEGEHGAEFSAEKYILPDDDVLLELALLQAAALNSPTDKEAVEAFEDALDDAADIAVRANAPEQSAKLLATITSQGNVIRGGAHVIPDELQNKKEAARAELSALHDNAKRHIRNALQDIIQ